MAISSHPRQRATQDEGWGALGSRSAPYECPFVPPPDQTPEVKWYICPYQQGLLQASHSPLPSEPNIEWADVGGDGEGVTYLLPGDLGTPGLITRMCLRAPETSGRIGEGIDFGIAGSEFVSESSSIPFFPGTASHVESCSGPSAVNRDKIQGRKFLSSGQQHLRYSLE
ncbi:hypothetical protein CB1_001244040 [Camelus ferus]|nr:hypothetical protein CB1_001244040 [Camelus ferus]